MKVAQTFEKHLQQVCFLPEEIDQQGVSQLLDKFEQLGNTMLNTAPLYFLIDYTKSQYLLMTNSTLEITNRDPREFLEGGIPMLKSIYQPDDFRIYNEKIFPVNLRFLQSQPQAIHHEFIFSYNFRIKHKNGNMVPILQRGCYLTSPVTGLPIYSLGMVTDISPLKKDRIIYQTIERRTENGRQLLEENYYYPYEEDSQLSSQELRVLGYMAEGLSSKQIAWKLNIAENTVNNHRKNMLKKTNTKNVAELIAVACRARII
ncbi:DNA-binding CsgD family transcriptional regulator [Chitinophaga terrae (ex Kim and Jung 2007)]|uniref:LuxR C-terminal-related transcriptional regulator n=1 Tax=Chitinophaga terrae (ex Kim and Jung 2007) TaxID=408074 RepID=UPI002780DC84|nr:LuxR C-terminal-related transcriptional regulator [Chitinophaga terrae (ex Kim and Jung 2007)]MDQ0108533.1 DNA-binding CsgD family transcriptional regulator [Chitinophaga terrae (ex Kim and Jung 2007)]